MPNFSGIPRFFERHYPSLGCCLGICLLYLYPFVITEPQAQALCNAFFTIFSICCGFISTSLSILFSLQERQSIKILKTSGAFSEIIDYHWMAIFWCLLSIVSAFIVIFLPKSSVLDCSIVNIMLAIGFGGLLAVYRLIHLLVRVLRLEVTHA